MTAQDGSSFEEVLADLIRERAKNIVQARSGWGAARDLDMLDVRALVAEAHKLCERGERPPKRVVADWRADMREPLQVIVSSVENICVALDKDPSGQKFRDMIVDSANAVTRNVERLDAAVAVLDAAFPKIEQAIDFDDQIRRVASEVRESCRCAAVAAPLHREAPEDMVAKVNIDSVIKYVCGDGT